MLLAVDIGNSSTVLALFNNYRKVRDLRLPSGMEMFPEIEGFLSGYEIDKCAFASVVPDLTGQARDLMARVCSSKLLEVTRNVNTGLDNSTLPPELGSDMICNLLHAHSLYPGEFVTVADLGTAFTTSTVSPQGRFMGATIAPGVGTSVKALFDNTAQVPLIDIKYPSTVFGTDTAASVSAGILMGFRGQIDGIVAEIERELKQKVRLVVTGGYSFVLGGYLQHPCTVDLDFTIEGVRLACLMN